MRYVQPAKYNSETLPMQNHITSIPDLYLAICTWGTESFLLHAKERLKTNSVHIFSLNWRWVRIFEAKCKDHWNAFNYIEMFVICKIHFSQTGWLKSLKMKSLLFNYLRHNNEDWLFRFQIRFFVELWLAPTMRDTRINQFLPQTAVEEKRKKANFKIQNCILCPGQGVGIDYIYLYIIHNICIMLTFCFIWYAIWCFIRIRCME